MKKSIILSFIQVSLSLNFFPLNLRKLSHLFFDCKDMVNVRYIGFTNYIIIFTFYTKVSLYNNIMCKFAQ